MAKTDNEHPGKPQGDVLSMKFPFTLDISFPGNLEYIPTIRKFISDLLQVSNFSPRFAYRSEIIVDEICNNAVVYGCHSEDADIHLASNINSNHIEFIIKDQGGSTSNLNRLKKALDVETPEKVTPTDEKGLGIEIVRMLSERMDVVIDENNLTSVHIVRKREDERSDS